MPLDAVLRAGRRLEAEAPARFRLEAAGPLARGAEAPTADPWWDRGRTEREEQDRTLVAACQRLPGGVHGIDSWSYKEDNGVVVDVKTLRLSHAGAFELVRQALAACPDRQTNHPYNQHILEYLQTLGGSVDAAKLGQLEEMISTWTRREYKVPKDVREALLHHDKSKGGRFGGDEPTTDAFLFVLGCSLAAATTVPFLWWLFAAGALSAAGSRAVAAVSGLEKQQKLRDYLTKSAAPGLQADTDKFTAPQLTRLFDWIAEFLSKAWTHALQAAYTMPDRRLEVRVAYSDELKGRGDAERIRGEMHALVEDFARMPREQLPSAASLDAEFGLGEATGICLKGPSAKLPSTAKNKRDEYKTWLTNVTVPAIVSGNTEQTALVLVKTDQGATEVEYTTTGGKGIYTPMIGQNNQSMNVIASLDTVTFSSGNLVTFELTLPGVTPLEIKYDYKPGKSACIETSAFKLASESPTPLAAWSQWQQELPRLARDIARAATTAGCAAGGKCVYAFKEKKK